MESLNTIHGTVIVGGAIWTAFAGFIGKRLIDTIDTFLTSKIGKEVLADATRVAKNAVLISWKEYVKSIKTGREDGKLTSEEKGCAFEMAKEQFLKSVRKDTLEFLKNDIPDIDEYVKGILEHELNNLKKG